MAIQSISPSDFISLRPNEHPKHTPKNIEAVSAGLHKMAHPGAGMSPKVGSDPDSVTVVGFLPISDYHITQAELPKTKKVSDDLKGTLQSMWDKGRSLQSMNDFFNSQKAQICKDLPKDLEDYAEFHSELGIHPDDMEGESLQAHMLDKMAEDFFADLIGSIIDGNLRMVGKPSFNTQNMESEFQDILSYYQARSGGIVPTWVQEGMMRIYDRLELVH